MGEDKSTHNLEMRRQRGLRTSNTDGEEQKHALAREETKGGVRTANTDGGGQRHTLPRNEETKGGSEDSKHRWERTKAPTN